MWHNSKSGVMMLTFAAVLPILQFAGCAGIGNELADIDILAIRRMTFEALHDRIGNLDKERTFFCRKEWWRLRATSWDAGDLYHGLRYCSKYKQVKIDEDPPDDERFGDELIELLRKCTLDDAVSFGAISNRIANTAGLVWFGEDGASLAGIAAITDKEVYFIYTEMGLFEGPGQPFFPFDILEDPPYHLWQNPYFTLRRWMYDGGRLEAFKQRIGSDFCFSNFCFGDVVAAFRMDISPEEFKKGRLRIVEPIESDIANLRGLVFETIGDRMGKLGEDRAFYCRLFDDWPFLSSDEGIGCGDFCIGFGVVKPREDAPDNGHLGEEMLASIRRCTMDDAVSFGSISNWMVRTAGLAWFGKDGASFAGVAVVTPDDVYFLFTDIELVTDEETWCHPRPKPPYYAWREPGLAQHCCLMDEKKMRSCMKSIYSKLGKMYPNDSASQMEFDVFLSDNSITAFRMDISPEEFQTVEKPGIPPTGDGPVGDKRQ